MNRKEQIKGAYRQLGGSLLTPEKTCFIIEE